MRVSIGCIVRVAHLLDTPLRWVEHFVEIDRLLGQHTHAARNVRASDRLLQLLHALLGSLLGPISTAATLSDREGRCESEMRTLVVRRRQMSLQSLRASRPAGAATPAAPLSGCSPAAAPSTEANTHLVDEKRQVQITEERHKTEQKPAARRRRAAPPGTRSLEARTRLGRPHRPLRRPPSRARSTWDSLIQRLRPTAPTRTPSGLCATRKHPRPTKASISRRSWRSVVTFPATQRIRSTRPRRPTS